MKRLALTALIWCVATSASNPRVDVVIHGGTIYTGAEGAPFVGDVELTGDRIVYVGRPRGTAAGEVIDARGMIVAPGLIDAHTHPDSYIRSPDPKARLNLPWLTQGVSTVVIGVDGYGTFEVAKDAHTLEASGIGTNIVPFVGFGAIRTHVLGQDARAPTSAELAEERRLAGKGMCEGAYGLSTGLFYPPQSFAKTAISSPIAKGGAWR